VYTSQDIDWGKDSDLLWGHKLEIGNKVGRDKSGDRRENALGYFTDSFQSPAAYSGRLRNATVTSITSSSASDGLR
jgi:hypothetical protein